MKELKQALLDLIISIEINERAYDDDLEDTYAELMGNLATVERLIYKNLREL